jgi:hypothetical protein
MISSHASMHWAQAMQSSWRPFRMSMPVGQTTTQRLQSTQSPLVFPFFPLSLLPARFAAPFVIADHQRVVVDEHRLEPAVRAEDDAHLLAEKREVAVEERGHRGHPRERLRMLARRVAHHRPERRERHEIRDEDVGDEERGHEEERVTRDLAERRVLLGDRLRQVLDRTEDALQENGLRACPPAPYAADERGRVGEPERESGDDKEHEEHVLWPERRSEKEKPTVLDVQEERGTAVDVHDRQEDPYADEKHEHDPARCGEAAAHARWIDRLACSVRPDRALGDASVDDGEVAVHGRGASA